MSTIFFLSVALASFAGAAPWSPSSAGLAAKFVEFTPARFRMGNPAPNADQFDEQAHNVAITRPFSMQATEVTQLQYFLVTGKNPSRFRKRAHCPKEHETRNGVEMCPSHPVERVSWDAAQQFVGLLNEQSKEFVYRLPTEAEWELAAQKERARPASAWFAGNSRAQTQRVGSKQPSANGVHDLLGNVSEWVADLYGRFNTADAVDPTGPTEGYGRVVRGGNYQFPLGALRVPMRGGICPQCLGAGVGFRLVRVAK